MKKRHYITHAQFKEESFKRRPRVKSLYKDTAFEYTILNTLIHARNAKKLSQRQFAKQIGVVQSSLARFESGNANPTLSFLEKVTRGLGLVLTVKRSRVI